MCGDGEEPLRIRSQRSRGCRVRKNKEGARVLAILSEEGLSH